MFFTFAAIIHQLISKDYETAISPSPNVKNTSDVDSNTFSTPTSVMVNGHEFVDLGLPSGLKWATCNVGASSPGADGDYFAWGETEPKSDYNWDTYKWSDGDTFTKYTEDSGKITLDAADDAATQNWGKGCRMPTVNEFEELLDNTTQEWTTMYGVNGYKFTSKANGAFVFFPASGYRDDDLDYHGLSGDYWSSWLGPSVDTFAFGLHFRSSGCIVDFDGRSDGHTVRAVCP